MDLYHIWFDLADGIRDTEVTDALSAYLEHLKEQDRIAGWRLSRRKLGLGLEGLPEFHVILELRDLAQLDSAFRIVSGREEPVESLHHAVNSKIKNAKFALYRDFPDPGRHRGSEKF